MIEVEVRLADGAFYRAFVTAVNPNSLLVAFDNEFVFVRENSPWNSF